MSACTRLAAGFLIAACVTRGASVVSVVEPSAVFKLQPGYQTVTGDSVRLEWTWLTASDAGSVVSVTRDSGRTWDSVVSVTRVGQPAGVVVPMGVMWRRTVGAAGMRYSALVKVVVPVSVRAVEVHGVRRVNRIPVCLVRGRAR